MLLIFLHESKWKKKVWHQSRWGCMGERGECMVAWERLRGDIHLFSTCNSRVREKLMKLRGGYLREEEIVASISA